MNKYFLNKSEFEIIDARKLKGNFFPFILKKARETDEGKGICIIQSFEPVPLYNTLAELGFEHETEKTADNEYKAYFFRVKKTGNDKEMLPLKPTAILNLNTIDPALADIGINFWGYIWDKKVPAIDMKTKLLLSLANGVGAGRMRQATREFIKGYASGISIEEFSELFSMFVWNQGIGYFASEIGPSPLFAAFDYTKNEEKKGTEKSVILEGLLENFGEKNPSVSTLYIRENRE